MAMHRVLAQRQLGSGLRVGLTLRDFPQNLPFTAREPAALTITGVRRLRPREIVYQRACTRVLGSGPDALEYFRCATRFIERRVFASHPSQCPRQLVSCA